MVKVPFSKVNAYPNGEVILYPEQPMIVYPPTSLVLSAVVVNEGVLLIEVPVLSPSINPADPYVKLGLASP